MSDMMNNIMQVHEQRMQELASWERESRRASVEAEAHRQGYAHVMFGKLMSQVRSFEASLKDSEEIGAYLAAFGTTILLHIDAVTHSDPYLIVFDGKTGNGERARLVQHVSQINVLFVALPIGEERPPKRIGFTTEPE